MGGVTEREVLLTGIGGQGVQLAAQVLARGAIVDGRDVMLFGSYGGMMRGGNTDATVVVGDGPVQAPPTVPSAWAAVVMHHDYWSFVRERLRPDTVVVVNSTVFTGDLVRSGRPVHDVPVTALATDLGNVMAASLVAVGALAALTGIVTLDALCEAVGQALPAYRSRHVEVSREALRVGAAAVPAGLHPAWPTASVAGGPRS